MKLELPPVVCSLQDVKILAREVREYASWYRQNQVKKRFGAKKTDSQPNLSPATREVLGDFSIKNTLSSTSLDELIAALDNFGAGTPEITFTLVAPATTAVKKSLVAWCRKNIEPDILVNFEFNSNLLGGMVLRYKSRVFDWSFRRQILDNRQKFSEVLARV